MLQQHSSVERFNHAYAKGAAIPQQCEGFSAQNPSHHNAYAKKVLEIVFKTQANMSIMQHEQHMSNTQQCERVVSCCHAVAAPAMC